MTDWIGASLPLFAAGLGGAALMSMLGLLAVITRQRRVRYAESLAARQHSLRAATMIASTVFQARQAMWRESERSGGMRKGPDA